MLKWSYFALSTILLLSASVSAQNQPKRAAADELRSRQVIASASGESIRFASLGELIEMRLEVIGSSGEALFDSNFKTGNVIDWPGSDKQGRRLTDGSYLCIVTVKDSLGQLTQKQAIANFHEGSVRLSHSDRSLLTAAQVEAARTT